MILTSDFVNATILEGIVCRISDAFYEGNLTLKTCERKSDRRVSFTLKVRSSAEAGAHYSPSIGGTLGRRTVSACWHAHRDVMAEILKHDPTARITSSFAKYEGLSSFLELFPPTYYRNVGNMAHPVRYGTLCHCEDGADLRPCHQYLTTALTHA